MFFQQEVLKPRIKISLRPYKSRATMYCPRAVTKRWILQGIKLSNLGTAKSRAMWKPSQKALYHKGLQCPWKC